MDYGLKSVKVLELPDGQRPFQRWYRGLSSEARAKVDVRLELVARGHFGEHRRLRRGIIELKIHFGQGLRVYGAEWKGCFFLLVHGGFKKSQQEDIKTATQLWVAYTKALGRQGQV